MFLMQLAIYNIDFANSEAATADIYTITDCINDVISSTASASSTASTSATVSASSTADASLTANSMEECNNITNFVNLNI